MRGPLRSEAPRAEARGSEESRSMASKFIIYMKIPFRRLVAAQNNLETLTHIHIAADNGPEMNVRDSFRFGNVLRKSRRAENALLQR